MGLAVLPARLKDEMAALEQAILDGAEIREDEVLAKHADFIGRRCLQVHRGRQKGIP